MAPRDRTAGGGRPREGLSGFASLLLAIALVLRNLREGRPR
jgi:hypothetical protein